MLRLVPHHDSPARLRLVEALRAAGPTDRLGQLLATATDTLRVPIAAVTLIGSKRQYFLSHVGLPEPIARRGETSVLDSFCRFVVLRRAPFTVTHAQLDPLLWSSVLVRAHGWRSYAGAPLRTVCGNVVGAFCVADREPRDWTPREIGFLEGLARAAMQDLGPAPRRPEPRREAS